jgi:hypothetical protein
MEWIQPAGFSWQTCTIGDPASDECDPATDPTRDNALAFATVFLVQCCAIALGHVVLMWKLRRMVADHQRYRRRAMSDPALERRARRFVADAKARADETSSGGQDSTKVTKMSAIARFRRAGIVAKFSARARRAAQEAPKIETVDDVVLEISEIIAEHWKASTPFFVCVGTASMTITFLCSGFVVNAQTL